MQYCAGVLQDKKCVVDNGVHKIIDYQGEDIYLFETGLGFVVSDTNPTFVLNKDDLSYSSFRAANAVFPLNILLFLNTNNHFLLSL